MEIIDRCSQVQLTRAALVRHLGVSNERIGQFISLAHQFMPSGPGRGSDVEVGLSVLTQAMCAGLGVDAVEVARAYQPFIRAALLHLATNPTNWRFPVDGGAEARLELFDEGVGVGFYRRRLQELLGIQERPTNRYLVRRPGNGWVGCDDLGERIAAGAEPMIWILDAVAVADKFGSSLRGPYFNWHR